MEEKTEVVDLDALHNHKLRCLSCEYPYEDYFGLKPDVDGYFEWRCARCTSINRARKENGKYLVKLT